MAQLLQGLVAGTLFTGSLAAQVNPFVFYPQDPERQTITCTSFVGRPDVSRAGEALMEIDDRHLRGVGDANGILRLFGVYHWVADENLSTIETYDLVVRSGAGTAGPDMTPSGEYLRIAGLTTPPSPSTQRGTWIMYDGFSIAGGLVIVPIPARLYVGVGLPANPLWPSSDGHSLFRADLLHANTGAVFGENHRAGAPDPTWAGLATAPSFSTPWSYILGPFVTSPNLHMGGIDPTSNRLGAPGANYGMNGLFPDVRGNPRRDGIAVRVTDNLAPFGLCYVGAALGFQTPYFHFPLGGTLIGMSHIGDPNNLPFTIAVSVLQNGVFDRVLALPGTVPTALAGSDLAFQAIVWDPNPNLAEWTNAQAVHF